MKKRITPLTLPEKEYALPGNRSCSGCSLAIAYRHGLKALGDDIILTVPASCLTVLQGMYPISSMLIPSLNTAFATTAASASGIKAALDAQGKKDITVVAWAGDGGTSDIGIQALSGAADRDTDFLYVCYDNEGYMNTGSQRSGSTPFGAVTSTTLMGKQQHKKDMAQIMAAHNIPYIATASPSYPIDLFEKFQKAKSIKGTKYIHIFVPCPPGWGFNPRHTVKIGRMAVLSGMFDLYEIEDGKFSFSGHSRKIAQEGHREPVEPYLRSMTRFKKVGQEVIDELQKWVDKKWDIYKQLGYTEY